MTEKPKPPEITFRTQKCSASVYRREIVDRNGDRIPIREVRLVCRRRTKGGLWEDCDMRAADLPQAILVLQRAYEYVVTGVTPDEEIPIEPRTI